MHMHAGRQPKGSLYVALEGHCNPLFLYRAKFRPKFRIAGENRIPREFHVPRENRIEVRPNHASLTLIGIKHRTEN